MQTQTYTHTFRGTKKSNLWTLVCCPIELANSLSSLSPISLLLLFGLLSLFRKSISIQFSFFCRDKDKDGCYFIGFMIIVISETAGVCLGYNKKWWAFDKIHEYFSESNNKFSFAELQTPVMTANGIESGFWVRVFMNAMLDMLFTERIIAACILALSSYESL